MSDHTEIILDWHRHEKLKNKIDEDYKLLKIQFVKDWEKNVDVAVKKYEDFITEREVIEYLKTKWKPIQ